MRQSLIHEGLVFSSTPAKFYLTPKQQPDKPEHLVIDRASNRIKLESGPAPNLPDAANDRASMTDETTTQQRDVHGVIGIIDLLCTSYLILIDEHEKVGELFHRSYYRATKISLVPFSSSTGSDSSEVHVDRVAGVSLHQHSCANEEERLQNDHLLQMVRHLFDVEPSMSLDGKTAEKNQLHQFLPPGVMSDNPCYNYYYCYNFDITHSLQKIKLASPDFQNLSIHERADERFYWNSHLLKPLSQQRQLHPYCLPLLHGYIALRAATIESSGFVFGVICRRSVHRAGTRYYVRGADERGNVANFVETEQLLLHKGRVASYVQIRGSIPLFWSQFPNIKYKPKPVLDPRYNMKEQEQVFNAHMSQLLGNYSRVLLLNLVNKKKPEDSVGTPFHSMLKRFYPKGENASRVDPSNNVVYEWFDFHKVCGSTRWHLVDTELVSKYAALQDDMGYFECDNAGPPTNVQRGVIRTNCMDCLDRTNVVQSRFALRLLNTQLVRFGVIPPGVSLESNTLFYEKYRNIWADAGDTLSLQYAGSGAMKSDYTRRGYRSSMGKVEDLFKALRRYVLNNFHDGFKQDALDLVAGNYQVAPVQGSPMRQDSFDGVNSTQSQSSNRLAIQSAVEHRVVYARRKLIMPLILLTAVAFFFLSPMTPLSHDAVFRYWPCVGMAFVSLAVAVLSHRYILSNYPAYVDDPKLYIVPTPSRRVWNGDVGGNGAFDKNK